MDYCEVANLVLDLAVMIFSWIGFHLICTALKKNSMETHGDWSWFTSSAVVFVTYCILISSNRRAAPSPIRETCFIKGKHYTLYI